MLCCNRDREIDNQQPAARCNLCTFSKVWMSVSSGSGAKLTRLLSFLLGLRLEGEGSDGLPGGRLRSAYNWVPLELGCKRGSCTHLRR